MSDETKDTKVEPVVLKDPEDGNGENVVHPIDAVVKLSEQELMKFNYMQLQIDHLTQSIRVLQLEHEQAHREFINATHVRNKQIEQHQNKLGPLQKNYETYVRELADKFGIPSKYLGIDDETGVVREMPHPPEEPTN